MQRWKRRVPVEKGAANAAFLQDQAAMLSRAVSVFKL